MKMVAKFRVDDKFAISGKGIILTGYIAQGDIKTGNLIELNFENFQVKRKIIGREFSRCPHNFQIEFDERNIGILIECKNEEEINTIKESQLKNVYSLIFEKE